MILEWDVPFTLQTPVGNLAFNQLFSVGTTPLGFYFLNPSRCGSGAARRITRNNIAQADGEITHRKFRSGTVVELNVELWETRDVPACGGVLREMGDQLGLYLNSIDNIDGRLVWTPSEWPAGSPINDRMLDSVRSLGPSGQGESGFVSVLAEKDAESPLTAVTFALLSPLPYYEDAPQTVTNLTAGATIFQAGNANYFPVIRVYGPTSTFTLTNTSALDEQGNPLKFVYDSSLPGGAVIPNGHYAEIIAFRNTVYLDGNSSNLKAGVDVLNSDFWPIVPGTNVLTVGGGYSGSHIDLLWQAAFS